MHQSRYPFRFDPAKVIGAFGGVTKTYQVLHSMGVDVKRGAVQKWTERGVVPPDAVVALHLYSMRNNLGIGLHEFLADDQEE